MEFNGASIMIWSPSKGPIVYTGRYFSSNSRAVSIQVAINYKLNLGRACFGSRHGVTHMFIVGTLFNKIVDLKFSTSHQNM